MDSHNDNYHRKSGSKGWEDCKYTRRRRSKFAVKKETQELVKTILRSLNNQIECSYEYSTLDISNFDRTPIF